MKSELPAGIQRAEGTCRSAFGAAAVSLAGRAFFKSQRHKGQRVATENTMRPNATHCVFGQILISTSRPAPDLIDSKSANSKGHTSTKLKKLARFFLVAIDLFFF
jgi:hypothetical protein